MIKEYISKQTSSAFTLAELLIALAILGVIATFTIPKVLNATTSAKYKAIAKENVAMLSGAFQQHKLEGNLSSATRIGDITPYMNHVAYTTSLPLDDVQNGTTLDCSATFPCITMHNGSVFQWQNSLSFAGTANTNAVWIHIDPDGVVSNNKAVGIFIYYNGRIADEGNISPNTVTSGVTFNPNTAKVPPWFGWD